MAFTKHQLDLLVRPRGRSAVATCLRPYELSKLPSSFSAELASFGDRDCELSVVEKGGILAIGLLELSEMLFVDFEAKRLAQDPTGGAGAGEASGLVWAGVLFGSDSIWCDFCASGAGFTGSDWALADLATLREVWGVLKCGPGVETGLICFTGSGCVFWLGSDSNRICGVELGLICGGASLFGGAAFV